ncbi:MAG: hypothetical protein EHM93_13680 [Bacteroidales bacterium]|nr:MAG: hypothetical protein EHM93_13680 [Bacteroidales bacterium]
MNNIKLSLSETILIGYFSVTAYLLALSCESGYLSFFNIPRCYLRVNLFESIGYFILVIIILLLTYFIIYLLNEYADNLRLEIKRIQKRRALRFVWLCCVSALIPLLLPFLVYFFSTESVKSVVFYFSLGLLFLLLLIYAELELSSDFVNSNISILKFIKVNIIWLFTNIIIFWSIGILYAQNRTSFLSIDNGKSVIIHFYSDKIFVKTVKNNRIVDENDFRMINMSDSMIYNFKTVRIQK